MKVWVGVPNHSVFWGEGLGWCAESLFSGVNFWVGLLNHSFSGVKVWFGVLNTCLLG